MSFRVLRLIYRRVREGRCWRCANLGVYLSGFGVQDCYWCRWMGRR